MHSPFTFNPNAHRAAPGYQQQSGFSQPVYNIGAPSSGFMSHSPNLFVNQRSFSRSFASVVSCENNLEKLQNMSNVNKVNANSVINNNQKPGLIGSILKHFNKPSTLQPFHQIPTEQKEFNDYTFMPSNNLPIFQAHQQFFYQPPSTNHINIKMPMPSESFYQPPPSANDNMTVTRKLMASLFGGGYEQPSQQQQGGSTRPRNSRWFNKGFRCRGGGRGRSHNSAQFRDHAVSLPKNAHEKERTFIGRDIQDDSCDFVEVLEVKNEMCSETKPANNPNETAKGSCYSTTTTDDPPFMIYSLEEFPAIISEARAEPPSVEKKQQAKQAATEQYDEGFVCVPAEASISMPSFTPKRTSLCEKLINSPKKLFPTCSPIVPKSCLKTPQRRVSECSDDFIVFADDSDLYRPCELTFSDTESETESDEDDDDDDDCDEDDEMIGVIVEDDEDEAMSEDEEDDVDGVESPEVQVDSGVEERRVRFNLTPTVHVMRVWDYAHRACRKGDKWQQMARDHERFKNRILLQQDEMSRILDADHRERIFRERFQEH